MKKIISIICILLTLNGYSQVNTSKQPSAKETKAIIEKLIVDMETAFNNNDMAKVASFYSGDAHISADNYLVSGTDAILKYWMNLKDASRGWKLEITETGGQGEYAYQLGKSDLKYVSRQNKEQRAITNFVLIWKLDAEGNYKIFRDYLTKTGFTASTQK